MGPLPPEGSASRPAHPILPDYGLTTQSFMTPKTLGLVRQPHTLRFSLSTIWSQGPVLTRILATTLVASDGGIGAQAGKHGEGHAPK